MKLQTRCLRDRRWASVLAIGGWACGSDRPLVGDGSTTGTSTSVTASSDPSSTSSSGAPDPTTSSPTSADASSGESTFGAADTTTGVEDLGEPCPGGAYTIFLNRNGSAWSSGTADAVENTTELLLGDPLGPYDVDDATWAETLACVRSLLDGLDVVVTDVDPGSVDHIEIAITGDSSDLHGLSAGIFAIGLPTCEVQPRGVGFVFVDVAAGGPFEDVCTAGIGFTLGLAAGLERSIGPCEVMSRLDCNDEEGRRFLDEEFLCGADQQTACMCGGAVQNSWQTLRENLGDCEG